MKPDITTSQIDINCGSRETTIAWFEDGDEGALVGQEIRGSEDMKQMIERLEAEVKIRYQAREKNNTQEAFSEYEYYSVELAVAKLINERGWSDCSNLAVGAWSFDSMNRAREVLKVAKATRKLAAATWVSDRPMPEWAVKATEAGWKPPKGWIP